MTDVTTTAPPASGSRAAHPPRRPWRPLVSAVVLLLALAGAATALAFDGSSAAGLVWLVAGLVLAWGWALLNNLPSRTGTTIVLGLGVALAYLPPLFGLSATQWLPAALAVAMICEFVHQLSRRDGRPRLVESVSTVVGGLAVLGCGALFMPVTGGGRAVAVVCAGISVGALVDPVMIRRGGRVGGAVSLVAGAVVGALVAAALASPQVGYAAVAAALGAAVSLTLRDVHASAPYLYGRRAQAASAAASVLVVGTLAAALRFLGG